MPTPEKIRAITGSCWECTAPPLIGTRCIKHMTRRIARRLGLMNAMWYIVNEAEFLPRLSGRYVAISEGMQAGDPSELVNIFISTHTHMEMRRKTLPGKVKINKIIRAVDRAARRKYGTDNRNAK